MKISLLASICILIGLSTVHAQQATVAGSHSVQVTGIAESSREPDFIVISITNREVQKSKADENATAEKETELLQTLQDLKVDTNKLSVQRFNTDNYNNWVFYGNKYAISKTYLLRIDDLARYEDIIVGIAKAGFRSISIVRLGLNRMEEEEQQLIRKAIAAGQAKAATISQAIAGSRLRLTGIEELENNFRREQTTQMSGWSRGDYVGVAGGLNDSPRNLTFGKVILRKAFRLSYTFE